MLLTLAFVNGVTATSRPVSIKSSRSNLITSTSPIASEDYFKREVILKYDFRDTYSNFGSLFVILNVPYSLLCTFKILKVLLGQLEVSQDLDKGKK